MCRGLGERAGPLVARMTGVRCGDSAGAAAACTERVEEEGGPAEGGPCWLLSSLETSSDAAERVLAERPMAGGSTSRSHSLMAHQ